MTPYVCCACGSECPGGKMCPVCDAPEEIYLFLDVDGVLNSEDWFTMREDDPAWPLAQEEMNRSFAAWEDGWHVLRKTWDLDHNACRLLQGFVTETACRVVMSSVWRGGRKVEIEAALAARHYTSGLLHRTPHIDGKIEWEKAPARSEFIRGMEIEYWILTHVPRDKWDDLQIVIIDDSSDMGRLFPWLVHTTTEHGLCPNHLPLAHKRLQQPLGALLREPNPLWTDETREALYG